MRRLYHTPTARRASCTTSTVPTSISWFCSSSVIVVSEKYRPARSCGRPFRASVTTRSTSRRSALEQTGGCGMPRIALPVRTREESTYLGVKTQKNSVTFQLQTAEQEPLFKSTFLESGKTIRLIGSRPLHLLFDCLYLSRDENLRKVGDVFEVAKRTFRI